jgi:glucose uptake protein
MVLVHDYALAVFCFVLTMTCLGSWANTQKMAPRNWRFELFYFDFIIGLFMAALVAALTLGSLGSEGRPFLHDLAQADASSIAYAMLGGIIWNLGNILLVAAIAVAGMSVGFPIGGGLAWIVGIVFNYILVVLDKGKPRGNTTLLFAGVVSIIAAIYLSMLSYKRLALEQKKASGKGIFLSVAAGLSIAFFYGLIVKSLDNAFVIGGSGTLTPFSGCFFFTAGALVSTPLFNFLAMRYPVQGERVYARDYFKGSLYTHLTGVMGGTIWTAGLVVSFMAVGAANPAVAYALSNASPVIAILWGVLVWKEFKAAPKGTNGLLAVMFSLFLGGLVLITMSNS